MKKLFTAFFASALLLGTAHAAEVTINYFAGGQKQNLTNGHFYAL